MNHDSTSTSTKGQAYPEQQFKTALQEWSHEIGEKYVDSDARTCKRYGRSTSPWNQLPVAVLRPGTVEEVQSIVQTAARYHCSLYPISGGKNWGMGDACPVGQRQVILDLQRLNSIREVHCDLGYAVVEAGVTQQQLFDYLALNASNLAFDATGAGPNATIVGNVMERGFGHSPNGDRYHNSCNYEVILADGRLLKTGFGHFANCRSQHLLKAGLGPSLDGLFTQSNLGIVTAITVWLMPKPTCFEAFAIKIADESALADIVDALRPLRLQGILPSAVHIANDLRVVSSKTSYPWDLTGGVTPLPEAVRRELRRSYSLGAWNVLGGLYGTKGMVRSARKALKLALKGIAKPRFINDSRISLAKRAVALCQHLGFATSLAQQIDTIDSVFSLLKGEPVSDHLRGTAWRSRSQTGEGEGDSNDPLDRGDGFIWLSPTVPMTGKDAVHVKQLAERVFRNHGFDLLMTFVSISGRSMCCPMTICYDKSSHQDTTQAKACYEELLETMLENGYHPYRLGIQSMDKVGHGSLMHWDIVREFKDQLDPQNILAPGRYAPTGDS